MRQHFDRSTTPFKTALYFFVVTFLVVVFGGIFVIGILAIFDEKGDSTDNLFGGWESIPEAGYAENVAITDGDNARNNATVSEEDKEYTYLQDRRYEHIRDQNHSHLS